ncbi:MAG: PAS domain S-box protein [Bacteroidia bacterium]|nr:PAS domain S-box protein [Bacteroidia bacterium]
MTQSFDTDYEHFFKFSRDLLCIAGTDGFFKKLNPTWTQVLGWSEEELTSVPFTDFIHPEDLKATFKEVEKLSQGEPTIYFENRYKKRTATGFGWPGPQRPWPTAPSTPLPAM